MKMPAAPIENIMLAPCGMNCMVCYQHCYHKKPCPGCLNTDLGKPAHCRSCKIKECVKAGGLTHCFECAENPCARIQALEKSYQKRYNTSLIANGQCAKKQGITAFLESQRAQFTCPQCGGIVSIHDSECSDCQWRWQRGEAE